MDIKEKDLEEIIYQTEVDKLQKRGLIVEGECYRQLKIGNYGISDLIYISKHYYIDNNLKSHPYLLVNICELKKEKAGISAFLQAIRYSRGVQRYLELRGFSSFKIEITLIAPKIDLDSDYAFLSELIYSKDYGCISQLNNYSVNYGFDGIIFTREQGYKLSIEDFKTLKV